MANVAPEEVSVTDDTGTTRVELRGVTVQAGERILLENTSTRFEAGKVTLIVGRSGVGKTTLLKAIAGLLDEREEGLSVSGEIALCDEQGRRLREQRSIGVVFQDYALFDELSPLQNVRLARSHGSLQGRADSRLSPERLLAELGVPTNVRTASLSGGQRQRLAIARVLAYGPHVVLYDEPTSGLDSATAAEVTGVIERTYANHPCTLVIVTHDYEALSRIADAIFLIDPRQCTLRPVDKVDWPRLSEILQQAGSSCDELISVPGTRLPLPVRRLARGTSRLLVGTSRIVESCLQLPWRMLPVWKSPWWGCRFLFHYLARWPVLPPGSTSRLRERSLVSYRPISPFGFFPTPITRSRC